MLSICHPEMSLYLPKISGYSTTQVYNLQLLVLRVEIPHVFLQPRLHTIHSIVLLCTCILLIIIFNNMHNLLVKHRVISSRSISAPNFGYLLIMIRSQIKLTSTISAICTSPANLIIARAPDDFKEFSLAWSQIVRVPAGVCI